MLFPTMIEWITEVGTEYLKQNHAAKEKESGGHVDYTRFVENQYNRVRIHFEGQMNNVTEMGYSMTGELDDPTVEMAVSVFESIVNSAIRNGKVAEMIEADDLAIDYQMGPVIVEAFMNKVLPKVEDAMTIVIAEEQNRINANKD